MKLRNSLSALLTLLVACSAPAGPGAPKPDPRPVAPPYSPPAHCFGLKQVVANLTQNDDAVWAVETGPVFDGSCAVHVTFHRASNAMPTLLAIREELGGYTTLPTGDNGARVSLWISEPRTHWLPVLDENNQRLDDTENVLECEQAAAWLREDHPGAEAKVRPYASTGHRGACYVELTFSNEGAFKQYFLSKNERSLDGNLLFVHFKRSTGVVSTVAIRPLLREEARGIFEDGDEIIRGDESDESEPAKVLPLRQPAANQLL